MFHSNYLLSLDRRAAVLTAHLPARTNPDKEKILAAEFESSAVRIIKSYAVKNICRVRRSAGLCPFPALADVIVVDPRISGKGPVVVEIVPGSVVFDPAGLHEAVAVCIVKVVAIFDPAGYGSAFIAVIPPFTVLLHPGAREGWESAYDK